MAIKKTVVINVDTSQAIKSMDSLSDEIEKQEKLLKKLNEIYETAPKGRNEELKKRIDDLTKSIEKQKASVDQLGTSLDSTTGKSNLTVDVDAVQVDTGKTSVDQLGTSLDTVSTKAENASRNLSDVGDNGGAIAVLDRLTGGLATQIRDAAEASKLFNFQLKAMRGALIATGIGALVVALGLIVVFWDDINELITGANATLERHNEILQEQVTLDESIITGLEKEKELLILQGKSVVEINKRIDDKLALLRENNQILINNLKLELLEAEAVEIQAAWWQRILFLRSPSLRKQADLKAQDEHEKELIALRAELEILEQKDDQIAITQFRIANPELAGEGISLPTVISANELSPLDAARVGSNNIANDMIRVNNQDLADGTIKLSQFVRDEQGRIEITSSQARIQIALNTASILTSLAEEGSNLSKAYAISQATINTFLGVTAAISETYTIPAPLSTVLRFSNAAAIAAMGFAQVKNILSTSSTSSSAPGGLGGAGGRPATPSFNIVEGTEGSQIVDSINNQDAVTRTFVVGSDVTSSQELDRSIVESSSL